MSSWRKDPGEVLTEEVKLVTRLDDAMLAGERIEERAAFGILTCADMIMAHHAGYDVPLIERRLPNPSRRNLGIKHELDWLRLGYHRAKLGNL